MADLSKPLEKESKEMFSVNDLVLCYEPDPLKARVLYEAKIIDIDQTKDDQGKLVSEYYVHFQGWNKSWDRWVLEDQILTINENSRGLQSQLFKKAVQLRKRRPKRSECEGEKSSEDEGKSLKKEEDSKLFQIPLVSLDIPKVLATHLEDDCYCIQRKKKLIILPRKPCVTQILNDYLKQCNECPKMYDGRLLSLKIIGEVIEGLNTYFNFFLSTLLLYNFEREQYYKYFPEHNNLDCNISTKDNSADSTPKMKTPEIDELENNMPLSEMSSCSKNSGEIITTRKSSREKKPINILQSGSFSQNRNFKRNRFQSLPSEEENTVEGQRSKRERKSADTNSISLASCRSRRKLASLDSYSTHTKVVGSPNSLLEIPNKAMQRSRAKASSCDDDSFTNEIIKGVQNNDVAKTDQFRRSARSRKSSEETVENVLTVCYSPKSITNDAKSKKNISTLKPIESEGTFMPYPIMPNGDSPADIYGVEHLLRLFVKLPVLLAVANIEEVKINIFLKCVANFLEYLSKRKDLFSSDVYSDTIA